jgi:hypothetical protein
MGTKIADCGFRNAAAPEVEAAMANPKSAIAKNGARLLGSKRE